MIAHEAEPRVFPEGFLFGAGSAAYHMEGDRSGERAGLVDFDEFLKNHPEKATKVNAGEIGPDWWSEEVFQADVDRMAQLGMQFLRIGIEQARLQPDGPSIQLDVLSKYRSMVDYIQAKGMQSVITVNHFTLPEWIQKNGGWHRNAVQDPMQHYTEALADAFGDVKLWIGINEPSIELIEGYIYGDYPPGFTYNVKEAYNAHRNMKKTNHDIYKTIKKDIPDAQVGPTLAISWFEPKNPRSGMDHFAAKAAHTLFNRLTLKGYTDPADFIGVDYYTGFKVEFDPRIIKKFEMEGLAPKEYLGARFSAPEGEERADSGNPIAPIGFLKTMQYIHQKTHLPQLITENGLADGEDTRRPYYIASHLVALHEAITHHNIPVFGYTHMAAIDNIDWLNGLTMKYGLMSFDEQTGERHVRESADAYGEVAKTHELDLEPFEQLMTEGQVIQLRKNIDTMKHMRP